MFTADEIDNYKSEWLSRGAYSVNVDAELDVDGKKWCRRHLERQCWSMVAFATASEHTFQFEHEQDAIEFQNNVK